MTNLAIDGAADRSSVRKPPIGALAAKADSYPGGMDIWVLVMIEALTFAAYFVVYVMWWKSAPGEYLRWQGQLNLSLGVLNTLVLLTTSWSMASCIEHSRAGEYDAALVRVWVTIGGGLLFVALKLYEWSVEIGKGMTFTSNEFASFYYFLTGMHLLHVVVGFIFLGVVVYQISSVKRRSLEVIETGGVYWHMVDFLWVVIFTILYVMR